MKEFVLCVVSLLSVSVFVAWFILSQGVYLEFTSNKNGKLISIRKDKIGIIYQQGNYIVDNVTHLGVTALTVDNQVYEVMEPYQAVMDKLK